MGLISLLFSNPAAFIILASVLLYSVILHEVAHGWVALCFGDDTALRYGRLTLNPVSHLDPIGTLLLFFVGFGWARPVPVDYYSLRNGRFGLFSVALAGCATNIIIAATAMFLLQFEFVNSNPAFSGVLPIIARINIILGAFNLIPIPPLDGSKILMSFLPQEAQNSLASLEPYGFFILAFLLFTGLLDPVIVLMQRLIYGLIAIFFSLFSKPGL
ncbi:MAG: site-2 protease family protein [Candidatus Omnitrophica bacterium]|nr:site-2 protease family protein [Candidatus Omnitrophota bacterium]